MSEYLIINIAIIIIPLALSFESKLKYYKNIPSILISILFVSGGFILWDSIATKRGDWAFNPNYVNGLHIFGLPFEELLFFITVPYSCIFIYEVISFYFDDKKLNIPKSVSLAIVSLLILTAAFYGMRPYTYLVLLVTSLFIFIASIYSGELFKSKIFWITIAVTYIPFLAVNYMLTSIPIVTYNSSAILNIRLLTIPIEDFFYSFSMISFWLMVYKIAKKILCENRLLIKKKSPELSDAD